MANLLRILGAALALAFFASIGPAEAVQSSGCMPVTGQVSGLQFSEDVSGGLAALISTNSGGVAPVTDCSGATVLGQQWFDTSLSTPAWRMWDGAQGVPTGYFDLLNHLWMPVMGGGIASVASAATVDLCTYGGSLSPQNYLTITGTTSITSFGASCQVGQIKYLSFAGATQITYNSGSIITETDQSITTAAGDQAKALYTGGGVWRLLDYRPAAGPRVYSSGIAGGTANAIVVSTTTPSGFSLNAQSRLTFIAASSIGAGGATLDVNNTGIKNILKLSASGLVALTQGDIIAGQAADVFWDGTQYELLSYNAFPSTAVVAFNASACPAGWIAANGSSGTVDARGVVIRGQDNGRGANPSGTVAIGTYQADALQTFTVNTPINYGFFNGGGGVGDDVFFIGGPSSVALQSTPPQGGVNLSTETRMRNVTLLYCQKL